LFGVAPLRSGGARVKVLTRSGAADLSALAGETSSIAKSELTFAEPRRRRDKDHLRFVASRACLVCGRKPCEAHHLRFAQPRALGRKVSDEFTVPLCRLHHRAVHATGREAEWWTAAHIDPLAIALSLWRMSRQEPDVARTPAADDLERQRSQI